MSFGQMMRVIGYSVSAASLAACGATSQPVTPNPPGPCDGPVTVSVSRGATPTISWTPACGENRLVINRAPSPGIQPIWAITSGDLFGPSVKYGSAPSGAETTVPAEVLVPGNTYTVTVLRSAGEVIIKGEGSATFIP